MTTTASTGALWLDVTVLGLAFLFVTILFDVALFAHPGSSLDPSMSALLLWFTVLGALVVATGLFIGRRTHWKVPDPTRAKTK